MSAEYSTYRCGGCGAPGVFGIYCDPCRQSRRPVSANVPRYAPGETVSFGYRGTVKTGIISKIGRANAVILIEVLNGKKRKMVRVAIDSLMPAPKDPV